MNAAFRHAARIYARTSVESQIDSASPHRLIALLYDGAIRDLDHAILHMEQQEVAEKGMVITHAIRIIEEGLKAALDMNEGGEIAQNLRSLYDYMIRQLLKANLRNDVALLVEVRTLLTDLRSTWGEINPEARKTGAPRAKAELLSVVSV